VSTFADQHVITQKFGSSQVARQYRPAYSRDDAVAELDGQPVRSYVIRKAGVDAVVVSYVKPGNVVIHHRVFITPTGNLVADGAGPGENFRNLHALLASKGFVPPLPDDPTPFVASSSFFTTPLTAPAAAAAPAASSHASTSLSSTAYAGPTALDALQSNVELRPFYVTISREEVTAKLTGAANDTFLLRGSSAGDGSLALSFVDRGVVRHCRILRDSRGFYVDGDAERYATLVQTLRTFGFKIPDPVGASVAGYATSQHLLSAALQSPGGYGGVPTGLPPSIGYGGVPTGLPHDASGYGRAPQPTPLSGYVGVPDSLRVQAVPGYVGVPDSLRVNNAEQVGGYGAKPEPLGGGYGQLPPGVASALSGAAVAGAPASGYGNLPPRNAGAVNVAAANGGYVQLPVAAKPMNQKPAGGGYGAVPNK
jgi:hypothetical protein